MFLFLTFCLFVVFFLHSFLAYFSWGGIRHGGASDKDGLDGRRKDGGGGLFIAFGEDGLEMGEDGRGGAGPEVA